MQWIRSFWGKHPAFRDYLRINADDRLFYAFIQWLDKGWFNRQAQSAEDETSCQGSRFWVVPPNTFQLTCGMITASADSAGRPSPVLCAVKGMLPENPSRRWDSISRFCVASWSDMASVLAGSFDSIDLFKDAFNRISPPDLDAQPVTPDGMDAIRQAVSTGVASSRSRSIRDKMLHFTVTGDTAGEEDWLSWMPAIREIIDVMPYSAFIQNAGGRKHLYLYYRPLRADDFRIMWNRN